MNQQTSLIRNLVKAGTSFASIVYRSKGDSSLARYTIILGHSYSNLLKKSKNELQAKLDLNEFQGTDFLAAQEVLASLNKSLAAHAKGEQNSDYTKKDQYVSLGNGVNLNEDGTIQLFGLIQSKVELQAGTPRKKVNSSAKTIAKNKIRKDLPVGRFREFALDSGNIQTLKCSGNTLIIE